MESRAKESRRDTTPVLGTFPFGLIRLLICDHLRMPRFSSMILFSKPSPSAVDGFESGRTRCVMEATYRRLMATKPTRQQQQARDLLSEVLYGITEAYRLDGHGRLEPGDLEEIARRIGQVSSAFPLDTVVIGAIDRRVKALKLSSSAVDLISLSEDELEPLQTLRMSDPEFVNLVRRLEDELGGM